MLVATFGPTTAWVGKTICWENEQLRLDGFGPISARDVLEYDRQGHLQWPYDGMRAWVQGLAAAGPASQPTWPRSTQPRAAQPRKSMPAWAIALIVVAVLVLVAPILAAVAIPMVLGQRDKAHESAVKEGVHSIQVGVQNWAIDHDATYPAPALVTKEGLAGYVDLWPDDPYTGAPMTQGAGKGQFVYARGPGARSFRLTGYGQEGEPIITVP